MAQSDSISAEIIAIGDELTSGQRLDTNSQWLSQQLGDLGIRTLFHTTVADDLGSNIAAFQIASQRVDVVIATGGLGPTADDLTRESMATAFRVPLRLDEGSLNRIRHLFASRGRDMPERNRVQAMFPEGSVPILNPHGTAPGIDMTVRDGQCRIFALPGVPAEMKEMYADSVQAALQEQFQERLRPMWHHRVKCFGAGESALEAMLPDIIRRGQQPVVGITVSEATITLRVSAQAETQAAFETLIEPTLDTIHQTLGNLVFGSGDDELQHAVHRLLGERKQTLAVSEWGTAGLIAHWLHHVSDSETSSPFVGGSVFNHAKTLGATLNISTAGSPQELALAMARAVRDQARADIGLAVGAFPEPSKINRDSKVFIGLATADGVSVAGRRFAAHPAILLPLAAKQALDLVRLHLLDASP